MPPKKRKTTASGAGVSKQAKKIKCTRRTAPAAGPVLPGPTLQFTVRTAEGRTRTATPRVREVVFTTNTANLTTAFVRRLRTTIERAVQSDPDRFNGEHSFVGSITTGTNVVILGDPLNNTVASLAYLLIEDGNGYFIAGPPVTHGVRRRVHFLLGRHTRRVYVRKLVHSDQKPTEATLWPWTMNKPLRHNRPLRHGFAPPGVPRFVSCVNLGKDPNEKDTEKAKLDVWSIISEWLPGVTLERVNQYLSSENRTFSPEIMSQISADLLLAVRELQMEQMVHQDLTPANVMINQEDGLMPAVTLLDFSTMRGFRDRDHSAVPNDDNHTKVKDGTGVILCNVDMSSVNQKYQRGQARDLQGLPELAVQDTIRDMIGEMLQLLTDDTADNHFWGDWWYKLQADADKSAGLLIDTIVPPSDHKFGQKQPPSEPLAFEKREWNSSDDVPVGTVTPFTIGPHQKVWIEPQTLTVLKLRGSVGW